MDDKELLPGQLTIFDISIPEHVCKPTLGTMECIYFIGCLCDRFRGTDEYRKELKSDLIKGFSCSGCCHYCSEAPFYGGKCKFDCRYKKEV